MNYNKYNTQLRKLMHSNDFTLLRRSKHLTWQHTTGVKLHTSTSPSDVNAIRQVERDIRRKLIRS